MKNNKVNIHKYIRKQNLTPQEQFQMGVGEGKLTFSQSLKRRFKTMELRLEVMPFWRSYIFTYVLISSIAFPAIVIITMILNFDDIYLDMPLFYEPGKTSWDLMDKGVAVIIPIAYGILNLVLLKLCHSIFEFDRRLAHIIGITMSIINTLFIIAFAQILSISLL